MDKNSNAKLNTKKSQMAIEKTKKSASKKKKRSKKTSSKSDQSPELLEVEGSRALEQTGAESDSSGAQVCPTESPTEPQKSSTSPENSSTANNKPSVNNDSDLPTPPPATKTVLDNVTEPVLIKQTVSTGVLNEKDGYLKKSSVSFSNFEDVQTISNTLSTMSVKSKNGSSRSKTKGSSKSSSNGASKREKVKTEPLKSCINKAAEAAAKLKSEESLRWEFALEDEEQERERIHIYKINRRKRYLAAAQEKGLGWVQNYGNNGMPLLEEPTPEFNDQDISHASVTDFTPIRNIMASQSSEPLALGGEITC